MAVCLFYTWPTLYSKHTVLFNPSAVPNLGLAVKNYGTFKIACKSLIMYYHQILDYIFWSIYSTAFVFLFGTNCMHLSF